MKIRRFVQVLAAAMVAVLTLTGTAHAANASTDLLWYDQTSGQVSAWLLNGNGHVVGQQPLSLTCSVASTCAADWKPVGSADLDDDGNADLTWFNAGTGEVSTWLTDGNGAVTGIQSVDWRCDAASGCSRDWQPIALGNFDGRGYADIMWWNRTTGDFSAWILDGQGHVTGTRALDVYCQVTCADAHKPIGAADMNNDGRMDLVWFNTASGVVEGWLLEWDGHLIGQQNLDWHCDATCQAQWRPVGVGDVNGDHLQDITWHNATTGEVSSWLTNDAGTVLGKQSLDLTCGSGCADRWRAVDLVR